MSTRPNYKHNLKNNDKLKSIFIKLYFVNEPKSFVSLHQWYNSKL